MTKRTIQAPLLSLLLIVILSACGTSPPVHLYILEPIAGEKAGHIGNGPTIAIAPITLPERLKHKGIYTHDERFRAHIAAFDHWAEPLERDIATVLAENLSILIAGSEIITYPWNAPAKVDFTLHLQIHGFALYPGERIVLMASWTIVDSTGHTSIRYGQKRYEVARQGNQVINTVAAMSQAVEILARDIAASLQH